MKKFLKNLRRSQHQQLVEPQSANCPEESTILERLTDKNIEDLASNYVTFFYDEVTDSSYRIEIVETDGNRNIIVSVVPTGLGKVASAQQIRID